MFSSLHKRRKQSLRNAAGKHLQLYFADIGYASRQQAAAKGFLHAAGGWWVEQVSAAA
jgi:hypothetical protein